MTDPTGLEVGDAAHRTGLTVRALRHSDEIGLARPRREGARDPTARLVFE